MLKDISGVKDNKSLEKLLDFIYPIGAIYMSVNNTDPSNLFGGTWEKLENKFLLGSGDEAIGVTGGEKTHVLSGAEIPSHTHGFSATTNTATLSGSILDMASQSKNIDIDAFGCFSPFQSGTSRAYGTSVDGSAYDSVSFNGNHNHSVSGTTGATGNSYAHNNMPPYLVVNIWKRTE